VGWRGQLGTNDELVCWEASPYNTKAEMSVQKKTRRELLEEFVDKKPDDAFSRYGLAMECVNGGDSAAADLHFRALLESNPDYVPAYLMYAQMLARESRTSEAKQVLSSGSATATQKGDQHARVEMETLLADLG
jgi:thioredoxin-like negative regulator of GroEL